MADAGFEAELEVNVDKGEQNGRFKIGQGLIEPALGKLANLDGAVTLDVFLYFLKRAVVVAGRVKPLSIFRPAFGQSLKRIENPKLPARNFANQRKVNGAPASPRAAFDDVAGNFRRSLKDLQRHRQMRFVRRARGNAELVHKHPNSQPEFLKKIELIRRMNRGRGQDKKNRNRNRQNIIGL